MPIQRCETNGKKGWKYGKSGKCYTSRKAAGRQAAAIHASGWHEGQDLDLMQQLLVIREEDEQVKLELHEMAEGKARDAAVKAGHVLAEDFIEWAKGVWKENPMAKEKHKTFAKFVSSIHDWRADFVQEFVGTIEKTFDVSVKDLAKD